MGHPILPILDVDGFVADRILINQVNKSFSVIEKGSYSFIVAQRLLILYENTFQIHLLGQTLKYYNLIQIEIY